MSGISSATAQAETTLALLAAFKTALADETDLDITLGFVFPPVGHAWVSIGDTVSDVDPKAIGPARQLSETITISVSVGAWNPERDEDEREAVFRRAFGILGTIQTHIRVNDITLGGTVLWCVPGHSSSTGATPEDRAQFGEFTEIAATFVAQHRIRTFQ
ncbi:hypothetical protein QN345_00495 [Cryobacterium sp. 10I1]|uniref:hypothetical protein n=1 Tax=Cryobacterium sp. 10I1 TaxID=3048578 RepID=UPI002B2222A3|nr:hypothetical protein [Cryobacterium sp. 10I1]MEB0303818.1 hypothetical protein [Cryobacterium sp. 10I1]